MRSKSFLFAFILLIAILDLAGCGGTATSGGGGGGGGGGNNSTTVTITFTGASPSVVATQIGSGAYTQATLNGSTITLSIPTGTTDFAIAYVCPTLIAGQNTFKYENILMATTADGTSYSAPCVTYNINLATLQGSVNASAIPNAQIICVEGSQSTYGSGECNFTDIWNNFDIQAPQGVDEVLITANDQNMVALAIKAISSQSVPGQLNGGSVVTFSTADETTPTSITYNNTPSGITPYTGVSFAPSVGGMPTEIDFGAQSSYPAVPSALLGGQAEYQFVSKVSATATSQVSFYTDTNINNPLTVNYPDVWSNCTAPAASATPTYNFSSYTGFSGKSGVGMLTDLSWSPVQNTYDDISVIAYTDAVSTNGITVPNLSSLSSKFLIPTSSTTANWSETVSQFSSGKYTNYPINSTAEEASCTGQFMIP